MFILTLAAAVIIGYVVGGNLKNLSNTELKGLYFIFAGFFIEFVINMLIMRGIISSGPVTYILDIMMYILLLVFFVINIKNPYLLLMGFGFFLNALAIFFNGGLMPVSQEAMKLTNLASNISSEGLYTVIGSQTHFKILCDIIPINFIGSFVVSIGDIVSAVGMILFIVLSMKGTKNMKKDVLSGTYQ